ncbi:hypothetical protein [Streptomyces sp. IBSBF 2435]|uniref:hypothetical protein n=1 Tax=Streptomyces sp. IBSBF 2435 TaxID=2903531 RepID=UPI002FDBB654
MLRAAGLVEALLQKPLVAVGLGVEVIEHESVAVGLILVVTLLVDVLGPHLHVAHGLGGQPGLPDCIGVLPCGDLPLGVEQMRRRRRQWPAVHRQGNRDSEERVPVHVLDLLLPVAGRHLEVGLPIHERVLLALRKRAAEVRYQQESAAVAFALEGETWSVVSGSDRSAERPIPSCRPTPVGVNEPSSVAR